jgi:glucose/arabinose dehydrogenase
MRKALLLALAAGIAASCASAAPERAQREERAAARIQTVLRGLAAPVHVTAPASEPGRLYVVEQAGRVRVAVNGRLRAAPFLDIRSRVRSGGEQGLLSLAFHPGYPRNPRVYVNYTDLNGHTNVVEFRVRGGRAVPSTARRLLFVRQPYSNHNGGQIAFAPNGRLWVGMGDGGSGGDPENRAQNMGSRLGKMLSIDVRTRGVRIEANGVRNPWRFSFDRRTGDLWMGDVGQNAIEEINVLRAPFPSGLENFGWDVYEGSSKFEDKPLGPGKLVQPVAQYSHGDGCSVTGGFVYRGTRARANVGRYFYGDYCSGTIWSMPAAGGAPRREQFRVANLTSCGEDARGEVYLVSGSGTVYRLG